MDIGKRNMKPVEALFIFSDVQERLRVWSRVKLIGVRTVFAFFNCTINNLNKFVETHFEKKSVVNEWASKKTNVLID